MGFLLVDVLGVQYNDIVLRLTLEFWQSVLIALSTFQVEGSVHVAECQLHLAQRSRRPNLDGTAGRSRD